MALKHKNITADKVLFFTDIHYGIRSDSLLRLDVCRKVIEQIVETVKKNDIKHVFFAGDLFHSRVSLNVNTLNAAMEGIKAIAKHAHVFMIIGNHDIHYKNSTDIHSIKLFSDQKNITVIDEPTMLSINDSKQMLLVPWMSDLTNYVEESVDYMIGHFDISHKYLIASYIEEHSTKTGVRPNADSILNELINNELLIDNMPTSSKTEIDEVIGNTAKNNSNKYLGNFVNICKKSGTILAGHIHTHKDFKIKGRRFIFIGSPQQQNFGDGENDNGFYIHNVDTNRFQFIETTDIPVHIELRLSEIHKQGIDQFDYSICSNNYVKLIIDDQIDHVKYAAVLQYINEANPAEQAPPEYQVQIAFNTNVSEDDLSDHVKKIKQSKVDYIFDYIESIDETDLKPNDIDKITLYNTVMNYYDIIKDNEEVDGVTQ